MHILSFSVYRIQARLRPNRRMNCHAHRSQANLRRRHPDPGFKLIALMLRETGSLAGVILSGYLISWLVMFISNLNFPF